MIPMASLLCKNVPCNERYRTTYSDSDSDSPVRCYGGCGNGQNGHFQKYDSYGFPFM